jgi:hypothetical protein
MRTQLKTIVAALPLASLLWMTPPASAHDGYRSYDRRPTWSDSTSSRHPYYGRSNEWERRRWSESYRRPYSGRYNAWEQRRSYNPSWEYGKNARKYNKAMNRLARQEREAQEKAYRRYEGNRNDPRFRERLAEIDRKYDQKRYQVERNLRND